MTASLYRLGLIRLLLASVVWDGCSGPAEPNPANANLIVVGLESGRLLLVDSKTPAVVGEIGPRVNRIDGAVASRDGEHLFLTGRFTDGSWKLVVITLRGRRVLWTLDLATPDGTIPSYNGVQLIPGSWLAPSNDGTKLYHYPARQGTMEGIAVVDLARRTVDGFWGPMLSYGISVFARYPPVGADTLIVIGTRGSDRDQADDSAFVISTTPAFAVIAAIPPPMGSAQVWSIATSVGTSIYLGGDQTIGVYDLTEDRYTKVKSRLGSGPLLSSPNGGEIAIPDAGVRPLVIPPNGLLPILGLDLEPRAVIDLRPLAIGTTTPSTSHVAFSPGTQELVVTAGTGSIRSDFQPEPARLFFVNRQANSVRAVLDLKDWGYSHVFTLP